MKRNTQAPAMVEPDYQSSLVDLVRMPAFLSADSLPYTSTRRRSLRKIVAFVSRTMITWMISVTAAGAIIGIGYRAFIVINGGTKVAEDSSSMYAFGTTLFMHASVGVTAGGVAGMALGLIAGIALAFLRQDLSEERAS